jgi:polyhydroxybutyrate depolymerase
MTHLPTPLRLALLIALLWAMAWPRPGHAEVVTLGDRWYRIDLPARVEGAPILLALHGGGGNPDQFARASGLSAPANAAGFAVIYPAGTGRFGLLTWNGGYCCGLAQRRGVDDLAFLDQVAADASARFGLSAGRVYLTGMSNGAILAESYAATRPDRVAAVAAVSGTLDLARFPPLGPVPILILHGMADDHIPFTGGHGPAAWSDTDFTAVPDVVAAFLARQTPGLARTSAVIDPVPDGTSVKETTWTRAGRPVLRLLAVEGGGHVWPGGSRARRQAGATQDISAATEVLRFFAEAAPTGG